MDNKFKINPKDETLTWQTLFERIKNGFELQEIKSDNLEQSEIIKYNDSIVLAPDYQREYRSSISDESSLIESAILEIPIPPIFLASHKLKGVQVLNVVDGQHRLRAFFRYLSNEYALQDLTIIKDFNNCYFKNLPPDDQIELMSRRISTITFRNFPGKEFELEIFNRYNKGTKPLTPQDIRHAVFDSNVNQFVNNFCNNLMNNNDKNELYHAYAISKDRFQKKTIHENIFVILSIIEYGVIQNFTNDKGMVSRIQKSPQYAESYMKLKSKDDDDYNHLNTIKIFENFNRFVYFLTKITPYPFSREIYGISSRRGNKFQVSISMILAGVYRKLMESQFNIEFLDNTTYLEILKNELIRILENSHLEDPDYKASSTNPFEVDKVVNEFNSKLFF